MAQQPVQKYQVGIDIPFKKNAIINGNFNIWQRGTSFVSIANNAYSADRWVYRKSGVMVHSIAKSVDVPTVAEAGRLFTNSILLTLTTADTSIGATDLTAIGQRIEGFNFIPLAQQPMIISFWVKAGIAGTYHVAFANDAADRSYVSAFVINTINTWEYKTISISPSPSAGTWDYTNGVGLRFFIILASGSSFHTLSPDTWQTGNFLATASQVNGVNTGAGAFRITGVQLESGSVVTPIEQRTFNEELELCQRYYEKSYELDTNPGSTSGAGQMHWEGSENNQPGSAENTMTVPFSVRKRSTPTVVFYDADGNINRFSYASIHNNAQSSIAFRLGERSFAWQHDAGFGDTVGQNDLSIHYTADAEL